MDKRKIEMIEMKDSELKALKRRWRLIYNVLDRTKYAKNKTREWLEDIELLSMTIVPETLDLWYKIDTMSVLGNCQEASFKISLGDCELKKYVTCKHCPMNNIDDAFDLPYCNGFDKSEKSIVGEMVESIKTEDYGDARVYASLALDRLNYLIDNGILSPKTNESGNTDSTYVRDMTEWHYESSVRKWKNIKKVIDKANRDDDEDFFSYENGRIYNPDLREGYLLVMNKCGFCWDFYGKEEKHCQECPLLESLDCADLYTPITTFWRLIDVLEEGDWDKASVLADEMLNAILEAKDVIVLVEKKSNKRNKRRAKKEVTEWK